MNTHISPGALVAKAIQERGMTQTQAARALNVTTARLRGILSDASPPSSVFMSRFEMVFGREYNAHVMRIARKAYLLRIELSEAAKVNADLGNLIEV